MKPACAAAVGEVDVGAVRDYLLGWQRRLCEAFAASDGGEFVGDDWRSELGEGRSETLHDGAVFEKGGVSFSSVSGDALPSAAVERRAELASAPWQALGVSAVMHPRNPYAPTSHANLRFFTALPQSGEPAWWFGGGYDLTPCYGFVEDCRHWHRTAEAACAPFGAEVYPRLKRWCDEYFYLPHRSEARGVGGLFFDDWNAWPFARCLEFARALGDSYPRAYLPIVQRRCDHAWGQRERDFQLYRRGRYAEFNLIWDRGTRFGLQSGGRAESILMSLPPLARWRYGWEPAPGSPEAALGRDFLEPRDWLAPAPDA